MKKLIPSLMVAAFACSSAYAADSSMTLLSGNSTSVPATDAGCLILSSAVSIGLSANVNGSVFCREADGINVAMIMAGTCHTAGLSKTRGVACIAKSSTVDGTTITTFYPEGCTQANVDAGDTVDVNGPSLFMADTATGGSMVEDALGNVCSADNVQTYVDAAAAQL